MMTNKISLAEMLVFTPAQEEFAKYIFNGRLGKCLFYRDAVATHTDLDDYNHWLDPRVHVFVDNGLPMQKGNQALLNLMNDKENKKKPFIFVTTSLFIVRLFQQSLVTIIDHDKEGNLVQSKFTKRLYYGNINDTISDMYSDNELNMVADAVNNLIDKGNYIAGHCNKKEKKTGLKKYGENPVMLDFEKKFIGQIGDSFLRISLEQFAKIDEHFPRDDDYDDSKHGIEVPFCLEPHKAAPHKRR